ncbi:unnamed protein product [Microthlaspi erraticum]|uniref:Uncharacterized protein n=1 Tax=Microthlaspi erraticum TaxID=1685480 RepID=A0A6D2K2G2_9BRAS|nr:unnamed protein product [Microthlaspi erraticum]
MRGFFRVEDDDLFLFPSWFRGSFGSDRRYGISSSRDVVLSAKEDILQGSEGSNVEVFTKLRSYQSPHWRAWMSAVLRLGAHPGSRQGRGACFESVEEAP